MFNELGFSKFDITSMVIDQNGEYINPRIALISKSGGGKSYLIRDILYHMRDIPKVMERQTKMLAKNERRIK
jgi:hypothetical protein